MTSYDEIYNRFLGKIDDFDILRELSDLEGDGEEFVKEMLLDYLTSAISLYTYQTQDLTLRDDQTLEFKLALSDTEKEILSMLMVIAYLNPKIVRSDMIEHRLTSKDLREFSPANLLREVRTIKENMQTNAHSLMTESFIRAGL